MQALANNFVTDRYSGEVIAVGINTIREIVQRVPLLLEMEELEHIFTDAIDYRNYRGDKNVAVSARSMLNLLRELKPSLLKRRQRGKDATIAAINGNGPRLRQYGEAVVVDHIEGTEALPGSDEEEGDGWEVDSDVDSDDLDGENGWVTVEHSSDEDDEDEEDGEAYTKNADERRGIEETSINITQGTFAAKKILDQKSRLEATRILTPRDFERLAEIKKKADAGRKRKRNSSDHYATATVTYAYSHDIDSGTTVQPGDLEGYRVQKKRDLKERIAMQKEGQAGRDAKAPARTHGMSNREKEKKSKNYLMITKKRSVANKQRMSLMQQKKALQSHKMGMKKKTKLMTKLRGRRRSGK